MKSLLAMLLVAPASFCMGGTMPALGQAVVRRGRLGADGNFLYAANTLGGATGIVVTTFVLAPKWGMHASFAALMAGNAAVAAIAWGLSTRSAATAADARGFAARTAAPAVADSLSAAAFSKEESASTRALAGGAAVPGMSSIWLALAAFSGFNVLGLEILA